MAFGRPCSGASTTAAISPYVSSASPLPCRWCEFDFWTIGSSVSRAVRMTHLLSSWYDALNSGRWEDARLVFAPEACLRVPVGWVAIASRPTEGLPTASDYTDALRKRAGLA